MYKRQTYDRDANGVPTYRSNWSPALGLDVNTNYAMGNSSMNAAAFGVWSPIMMGAILQSAAGAGYNAAFGAQVAAAMLLLLVTLPVLLLTVLHKRKLLLYLP